MARKNATQQGANTEAETPTELKETPELNPRNDDLEQLARAQHDRMLEELGEPAGVDEQIEQQQNEPEPEPETRNEPRMVKVKVDGEEIEVPEEDVIRGYQKDSAASKRLEAATVKLREVEERERLLAEREAQLTRQTADTSPQPSLPTDVTSEFVRAIYEGDEAKTTEALSRLLEGRQSTTQPNINDIVPTVTQQVRAQIERDTALDQFTRDYKEIASDPYLASVADNFVTQGLAEGKPYAEALQEAGKQTRDWIKKISPPASDARTEKINRKERIDTVPTTNATSGGMDEQKEESASEVITAMRKSRGLTT